MPVPFRDRSRIPKVHSAATLAPKSPSTLARQEADFKNKTETSTEHIRSWVSVLKDYVVTHGEILRDDETKIEKQTQTLNSVTQRLSQTETSLEDITSKVSMLKEVLSMIKRISQDDDTWYESHTQTLNSVMQRLSDCESSIQTIHSNYAWLDQLFKTTASSNDLSERRLHVTEEQSTSNKRKCRELADSRDLHEQESNP